MVFLLVRRNSMPLLNRVRPGFIFWTFAKSEGGMRWEVQFFMV